jgi:hypothetical protein
LGASSKDVPLETMEVRTAKKELVYGYDNPEFQVLAEMQAFTQDESERQKW